MKIFMTGGTGLIGKRFIERFSHHQYTVLTRSLTKAQASLPNDVTAVDSLSGFHSLDGFDAVINLAGEPIIDRRWTQKRKELLCKSRWQTTQQLVNLMNAGRDQPPVFLSGSAIGIYGDQGDASIAEQQTTREPDFAAELCQGWEAAARAVTPKCRLVFLRTGIVLDRAGGALAKMLLPFKCGLGGPVGNGRQYMSWIHIQDLVRSLEFILTHSQCRGAYNLVAPKPVTNRQFTRELASRLNRIALLPLPKTVLRVLMGESSALLLNSQRVFPQKLLADQFEFQFTELRAALNDLLGGEY